jgi:hypothetical protein
MGIAKMIGAAVLLGLKIAIMVVAFACVWTVNDLIVVPYIEQQEAGAAGGDTGGAGEREGDRHPGVSEGT